MKNVKGIITKKARTGLFIEGTWYNVGKYTSSKTLHDFEVVSQGSVVLVSFKTGSGGGNFIETLTVLDSATPNTPTPYLEESPEKTMPLSTFNVEKEKTQKQILKNVVAYAVFQSPVISEMLRTSKNTDQAVKSLLKMTSIIESFLYDLDDKSLAYHIEKGFFKTLAELKPLKIETNGDISKEMENADSR